MTTGQNIRRIRQACGLTQWQLSQAVGMTPARILLIERGDKVCSIEELSKIAEALGVAESEIIQEAAT